MLTILLDICYCGEVRERYSVNIGTVDAILDVCDDRVQVFAKQMSLSDVVCSDF